MDKTKITISQGIVGEWPPAPPKELMRDGKWLVPPEQRPKGWETIGASPAPLPPLKVPAAVNLPAPAVIPLTNREFPKFPQKNQQEGQPVNTIQLDPDVIVSRLLAARFADPQRFAIDITTKASTVRDIRKIRNICQTKNALRLWKFNVMTTTTEKDGYVTVTKLGAPSEPPDVLDLARSPVPLPPLVPAVAVDSEAARDEMTAIRRLEQEMIEQVFELCRMESEAQPPLSALRESALHLKRRRRALELTNEVVSGQAEQSPDLWRRIRELYT